MSRLVADEAAGSIVVDEVATLLEVESVDRELPSLSFFGSEEDLYIHSPKIPSMELAMMAKEGSVFLIIYMEVGTSSGFNFLIALVTFTGSVTTNRIFLVSGYFSKNVSKIILTFTLFKADAAIISILPPASDTIGVRS